PTAAGSGPARTPTAGPRFSSRCPAYPSPRPRGRGRGEGEGGCPVTGPAPTVFVIDDDPSVRKALGRLLRAAGCRVQAFAAADEFLGQPPPDGPACLVLDVCLPGIDGLDLQRPLPGRQAGLPVVFITGHGAIPMSVRAMKAGAVDFLPKPFHAQDLLDAVRQALGRQAQARQTGAELANLRQRAASLSPRERE